MGKVSLVVFQDDCVGCHACELACKQAHSLDVGPRLIRVMEKPPVYVPIYCHHCAKPPCRESCPVEAISRDDRGVVEVDEELCIGCKACIEACPFGAMQFDEDSGVAVQCDLCSERLERGQQPACTAVCPTRCILWGGMQEIYAKIDDRLSARGE